MVQKGNKYAKTRRWDVEVSGGLHYPLLETELLGKLLSVGPGEAKPEIGDVYFACKEHDGCSLLDCEEMERNCEYEGD